jgi:DNA ligase-1
MRGFSQLLDDLVYTRSRNSKLKLIGDYLKETPDPDRGLALAALTGSLDIPAVKPAAIRALAEERIDPVLLRMSRDYVGDMAETVSLLWPAPKGEQCEIDDGSIRLSDAVERLRLASKADAPLVLAAMLDHLDASGRFAILKLATGALRVGISARLAKQAMADAFGLDVDQVEEVWHGLKPPYAELFDWGEGRAPQPTAKDVPVFRPFMLAHPLDDVRVSLDDYAAEWKWDGIRIQLVHAGGDTRLYSRTGDDISGSFPDIAEAFSVPAVLDGELLVRGEAQGGAAASFNALQQRLGRKNVSSKVQGQYPAFVRLYDILFDGDEDLRPLGWSERRARLESFVERLDSERFDLSSLIEAESFEQLEEMRSGVRAEGALGRLTRGHSLRLGQRSQRGSDELIAQGRIVNRRPQFLDHVPGGGNLLPEFILPPEELVQLPKRPVDGPQDMPIVPQECSAFGVLQRLAGFLKTRQGHEGFAFEFQEMRNGLDGLAGFSTWCRFKQLPGNPEGRFRCSLGEGQLAPGPGYLPPG